jgi:BirA family biotin operon repressor/biotin-[acetyl-CoA-carboxylase] ligase
MGLSTVAALAVSDAIKKLYNIEVQLKWPNDIYLKGVKLAGILIDLEGQALEPCHCVIGLGINLQMPRESAKQVDQPWTDLSEHTCVDIDRNQLVAELINCLTRRLQCHQVNGLHNMVIEWQQQDYFYNKNVKLITGEKEIFGICKGINEQGALLLEIDGHTKVIYGGEVSLRSVS